ncbi:MAG TPA: hypothetical protein DCZ94_21685 [Lentisphaeria bacterium]|nr:MAG: hypothetical protein A2X48_14615 [Lentisphaerae bacterium GWF2_49_21]HBC89558.1 hypothetical protein [Lentisphaeria bacterium]
MKKPLFSKKDIVYIAGPVRGIPKKNAPKFLAVEKFLVETYGCKVLNPVRITDPHVARCHKGRKGKALQREYARHDIDLVFKSTAIFMMSGWDPSVGATAEYYLSRWLMLKIVHEYQLVP